MTPIAYVREAKREIEKRVSGVPEQPTAVRPSSPRPGSLYMVVSSLLLVPKAHPSVPGPCSVLPGHTPVWDTCLGGEGNGSGLREGRGILLPGQWCLSVSQRHWCLKGPWSSFFEVVMSESRRVFPPMSLLSLPRYTGESSPPSSAHPGAPRKHI